MQRIVIRYHKDHTARALSHGDLRTHFLDAIARAEFSVGEGRRTILLGPSLPVDATSDAEEAVLELWEPRDPSDVCRLLNAHLPTGVHVERAWIAKPGSDEEKPATFDEAVYDILWHGAPVTEALTEAIRTFLAASEVSFTRIRERKTQQFNARAFVRHLALLASRDGLARLRMTLSVGPQGSVRPDEVLQVLGFSPAPGAITVQRVALQRSTWRHPSVANEIRRWRQCG